MTAPVLEQDNVIYLGRMKKRQGRTISPYFIHKFRAQLEPGDKALHATHDVVGRLSLALNGKLHNSGEAVDTPAIDDVVAFPVGDNDRRFPVREALRDSGETCAV